MKCIYTYICSGETYCTYVNYISQVMVYYINV